VQDLIPGLPAERVLRIGDRITHIDGAPLLRMEDLQFHVQTRRPGDKVLLSVQRARIEPDGKLILDANNEVMLERLEIEIELGSAELLRDFHSRINPANMGNQLVQTSPSMVERGRLREAADAIKQYSPQPRAVEVRGGPLALLQATARTTAMPGAYGSDADPQVEQHPAIQAMLMQRRLIADGGVEPQVFRQQWRLQLLELVRQTQEPGLPREQRLYLHRVIERYMELIEP
jgi:hypothetical protein